MKGKILLFALVASVMLPCCEDLDDDPQKYLNQDDVPALPLDEVAVLLSSISLSGEQVREVHDAVSSSSCNGYDEEYMMSDLFREPGAGVGDKRLGTKSAASYKQPLKDLIEKHVRESYPSSASPALRSGGMTAEEYLETLQSSDIQIYWPYSENWDGSELPIISFDPNDGASNNIGYRLMEGEDGTQYVEEVIVDEKLASEHPVWVVNRNDDSEYTSLEILRRENPSWDEEGGGVIVTKARSKVPSETKGQALILRDFTMRRNFDSWFAGASEFFVKIGSVNGFNASTDAELKLYSPTVTDFMIVVKRQDVGIPQPFNAILVSDWTEQLSHCAFIIIEDDGGKRENWKCSAVVKYSSKSYGFDISIPINSNDDIVWRGQLSRNYIMSSVGKTEHFGDVELSFEVVGY